MDKALIKLAAFVNIPKLRQDSVGVSLIRLILAFVGLTQAQGDWREHQVT